MVADILKIIGIIFLIFGVSAIINTAYNKESGLAPILWLCYICIILIGIAVLTKNSLLLLSQINILAIPLILWNIDFYSILIFNQHFFGIADYFFIKGPLIGKIITSQHLFTIPLSLYSLYLIKCDKNYSWALSFFQIILVFFITRLITPLEKNINCVFKSCLNIQFEYYPLIWFSVFFVVIILTNFTILRFSFFKKGTKKHSRLF